MMMVMLMLMLMKLKKNAVISLMTTTAMITTLSMDKANKELLLSTSKSCCSRANVNRGLWAELKHATAAVAATLNRRDCRWTNCWYSSNRRWRRYLLPSQPVLQQTMAAAAAAATTTNTTTVCTTSHNNYSNIRTCFRPCKAVSMVVTLDMDGLPPPPLGRNCTSLVAIGRRRCRRANKQTAMLMAMRGMTPQQQLHHGSI